MFTLKEIIEATSGRLIFRGKDLFSGISIDSRTITESELFIALRGSRFDGHDFLQEALEKCAGAIVNYPPTIPVNGKTIIHVNNTLKALQNIARYKRNARDAKVVGITGTNGKTTTKEMLCSIMKNFSTILCTSGNLNNQIGLPLNLIQLEDEEICVLEMGASKRGDIMELCEIASPDYGIITNIGPSHLEGFGSIETVKETKLELAGYVGTLVTNVDDTMLRDAMKSLNGNNLKKIVTYGINNDASVMAREIGVSDSAGEKVRGLSFDLHIEGIAPVRITMKVSGWFNVYNALAASAMAHLLGASPERIRTGLEGFSGVPMRLEIKELRGAVVISDVYNANPASMEEAVKELVRLKEERAIAVLGDMLELGSYAEDAHRKLGAWLAELPIDIFVAVGPLMSLSVAEFKSSLNQQGKEVYTAVDANDARDIICRIAGKGDTVLIKGSRGMNMEYILEANSAL